MKWLFVTAAAALCLAIATPALAAPQAAASRHNQAEDRLKAEDHRN